MDRVGRYRIIGELGRGAMGVVLRATDPAIGRDVAIKTIRLDGAEGSERHERLKERLFREARSAGVLSHPNIVTIYDMGEADGCAYIAMAFVNGPSLEKLLADPEPIPGGRLLAVLRQTAGALDYAHSRGVVHRDIKPANIMTDEDGSVKITDFGIARIAAAQDQDETPRVTGTPNYMSPEQVQGLGIDGRTDQFSLAVVAWEMLTGERPFAGENLSEVVYGIVSDEPPPAHNLNGTLTPQIDQVLRRALSKDPALRFANCSRFVGALDTACAMSPGWRTLPPGAAATLPTLGMERHTAPEVAETPPSPEYEPIQPFQMPAALAPAPMAADPLPTDLLTRRNRLWPVLAGFGLVSVVLAAVMVWTGNDRPPLSDNAQPPSPPARETSIPEALPPAAASPVVPAPRPFPTEKPPVVDSNPAEPVRKPVAPMKLQDIWVRTLPSGAKAVLDNKLAFSCQTPCILHALPGTHHVTLSMAGYMNEYRELRVIGGSVDLPAVAMRQPTGTLMLSTIPPGAKITLNGTPLPETTPAQLPLKAGDYTVTVEKDGAIRTEKVQIGQSPHYVRMVLGSER